MQNDDGVDNALENKNHSFSLFCMENSFVSKDVVVEVDVVDRKVPFILFVKGGSSRLESFISFY